MPPNQSAPSATGKAAGGASGKGGSPSLEENQEQNGKKPVTMADLEAQEGRFKQMLARQYQGIQSMIDRQSGSLKAANASAARITKSLEDMGIKLTDEQKQEIRENELLSQAEGAGDGNPLPGGAPDGQPGGQGAQGGTFGDLAIAMMRERGVMITQSDPELALIDQETQDPKVFMDTFDKALTDKVRRLAGLEPEVVADTDGNGNQPPAKGGPGLNPRGTGSKPGKQLPETKPGGGKTQPGDYLAAGFAESDKFPSEE